MNTKIPTIILKAIVGTATNLAVSHIRIFILQKITIIATNTNIRKINHSINNQNTNNQNTNSQNTNS